MLKTRTGRILLHTGLFLLTFYSVTNAGASHQSIYFAGEFYENMSWWQNFKTGFYFSVPFIIFITFHEFGHYFVAKWHRLKTSLPFYLPFPFAGGGVPSIGTFGAVIALKSLSRSKKQFFDVGIAGPLAGFVIAIITLVIGYSTLPDKTEIFKMHPDYVELEAQFGADYQQHLPEHFEKMIQQEKDSIRKLPYEDRSEFGDLDEAEYPIAYIGSNLLMQFFGWALVSDQSQIPSGYEIYHYPLLYSGFIMLLFTAINLIPIGQLDGGHVLYGLIGFKRFNFLSRIFFIAFLFITALGFDWLSLKNETSELVWHIATYVAVGYFALERAFLKKINALTVSVVLTFVILITINVYPPAIEYGYGTGVFFAILIGRMLGVHHPPSLDEATPLDFKRKILGVIALIILIISFSPAPFEILVIK